MVNSAEETCLEVLSDQPQRTQRNAEKTSIEVSSLRSLLLMSGISNLAKSTDV
jgi:hypothetical protein